MRKQQTVKGFFAPSPIQEEGVDVFSCVSILKQRKLLLSFEKRQKRNKTEGDEGETQRKRQSNGIKDGGGYGGTLFIVKFCGRD